jgi:uncharacterized membrane protein YcfT
MPADRIAWLDHAKGLCIVLVVALYATELVAQTMGASGWLGAVAAFAQPFRMPAFFFLSALLLPRVIGRDWRTYLDRKVLHFAYFYVLWLTLLMIYESPRLADDRGWAAVGAEYAKAYVHPFSMLWFIYVLPLFFIATRLLRRASPVAVWIGAAALQLAPIEWDIKVLDKFAGHYVYFYSGYLLAAPAGRLAEAVSRHPRWALGGLAAWALVNGSLVLAGMARAPVAALALGLLGAAAVVAMAVLLSRRRIAGWLRHCGQHSIVIYLAFLIPLEATHKLMELAGLALAPGWVGFLCTLGGILGAFALYWMVRGTRLRFLFERPASLSLPPSATAATRAGLAPAGERRAGAGAHRSAWTYAAGSPPPARALHPLRARRP